MFTGEESHGKYFDLHSHYLNFRNIKKLRQLNIIKADDYLTWLQNMDKFSTVPLYIKQSAKYEVYVEQLCDYLKDFFQRTNPLVEFKAIHD
jgi:splicing factor 3A subunit 3